ncbi:MAG: serine/threonine protein kinase [Planctomycetes bacterium]|nr:serine/threonine protein kinase [Planctomycetota bacterium]
MTTQQHWKIVKRLFAESRELEPLRRDAFLKEACMDAPELAEEVRMLLSADCADDFLEPPVTPITGLSTTDDANAVLGQRIGSHRLESLLGSGGMGNVYLGVRVEGDFEQQVAVKLLKRGLDTDTVLQQFRREQQTLAMLAHPSIAQLYDGGATPNGRPYFVMEYVEGIPIDRYCDEQRLSTTQRLNLFLAVCNAVGYAHQRLVVHRDLKPANILVTKNATLKLLDFGIAKVLSDAEPVLTTAPVDRRLTPEYASPEQIAGNRITTSSDVYSLGVVLYELLTGIRPYRFRTRTPQDIETTICREEPPAPSVAVARHQTRFVDGPELELLRLQRAKFETRERTTERLVRRLRGDLDTIILTALRKEPERRYSSVEAFAADIRNFLGGLPVAARRDTVAYRSRKFVGRHRFGTTVMVLLATILTFGAAEIIRYARIAERERDQAEIERKKAEQFAIVASQDRDDAYKARDQAEAITSFLNDALSAAAPEKGGPDLTVRQLLDSASAKLESEMASRPLEQAAVRSTIGRTYGTLGLYDAAETHLLAAYQKRLALLGDDHHDIAESRMDLASLRYSQGRMDEAETLLRQSLATHERLRGSSNLDTARVCNDLGAVLRAAGKLDEAAQMHGRALQAYEKANGRNCVEVAMSLNNLAGVYQSRGDFAAAEDVLVEALKIRRSLLTRGHPLVLQSLQNLAVTKARLNQQDAAEELLREAADAGELTWGPDHPDLAIILKNLAGILLGREDYVGAESLLRRASLIFDERYPSDHPRRIATRTTWGQCLFRLKKDSEGENVLLELLNSRPKDAKIVVPWADAVSTLIEYYDANGQSEKADQWAPFPTTNLHQKRLSMTLEKMELHLASPNATSTILGRARQATPLATPLFGTME